MLTAPSTPSISIFVSVRRKYVTFPLYVDFLGFQISPSQKLLDFRSYSLKNPSNNSIWSHSSRPASQYRFFTELITSYLHTMLHSILSPLDFRFVIFILPFCSITKACMKLWKLFSKLIGLNAWLRKLQTKPKDVVFVAHPNSINNAYRIETYAGNNSDSFVLSFAVFSSLNQFYYLLGSTNFSILFKTVILTPLRLPFCQNKSDRSSSNTMMNSLALSRLFCRNSGLHLTKSYSSNTATGHWSLVDKIALTDDRKTFVAWHPQQEFPYELTRPIPEYEERNRSAVIKENAINTAMTAFSTKHPEIARQELQRITFTTKHRWFPRSRDKKAKKTPMDRTYL